MHLLKNKGIYPRENTGNMAAENSFAATATGTERLLATTRRCCDSLSKKQRDSVGSLTQ